MSRKHPHGWSSSPNMWRDPQSVNAGGKKKAGCLPIIAAVVGSLTGFVYGFKEMMF